MVARDGGHTTQGDTVSTTDLAAQIVTASTPHPGDAELLRFIAGDGTVFVHHRIKPEFEARFGGAWWAGVYSADEAQCLGRGCANTPEEAMRKATSAARG